MQLMCLVATWNGREIVAKHGPKGCAQAQYQIVQVRTSCAFRRDIKCLPILVCVSCLASHPADNLSCEFTRMLRGQLRGGTSGVE